jgi:Site-specific recombinase XerD
MQPNVISFDHYIKVTFESTFGEIVYDPYPISDNGQQLDLTKNKCHLLPERILLNFELIHPFLREHTKAWISFACKKYAHVSLSNHFNLLKTFQFDDINNEAEIAESIERQICTTMESEKSSRVKSILRMIYGWFVEEKCPFFDEDFYDLYLDALKFGTDEGKGKDVIMELPNRGPLTLREQRLFRAAMTNIQPHTLSLINLHGMTALKIGQVLGARDIQVIKMQFKHIGMSEDGAPFLLVPRAKQRGHKNNNKQKKRAITKQLFELLSSLKDRYTELLGQVVDDEWPILCTLTATGLPINKPLTSDLFQMRRLSFEAILGLDFKVTNRRLRKTFCTQLIAKGTPLTVVAELMDHTDLQQLEVYYRQTHHIAKKLNEVLKAQASEILDVFEGKVIAPQDASQLGQEIFAPTQDKKLHLIGSCSSKKLCSLNPPLSCYGCSSVELFEDADHKGVVEHYLEETKNVFGEKHAIEILQHDDFLAAAKLVQMIERGEL